ncbi:MAG: zinc-binding dehydrogenase [Elusimicrobia bacterium]|jgi:S-(hydroxymethyl)glutathione dehydrogenase/alcohol dehydrogenase|nr:zinc-binding dehydrogenase [Elusimicrobiota bacterium]
MKFKAAVLVESRKPLVIEELEAPVLKYGQVLVKIICTGICGAQINEIDAVKGPDKFLPHLLGHEATAEVMECGEGVTTVKPGQRVVCHWRKGAGLQSPPPQYQSKLGLVNAGWVTTFSEYAVISENRLTPVSRELDPGIGALMGCAITTAMGVINNDARLGIGESIVVFGAGGVGLSMIQFAAMVGGYPIVAIDLYDNKLELAKRLGATYTLNPKMGDIEAEIQRIVGAPGADVTIENTGVADVIELAYNVTSPRGRTILVGVPPVNARQPRFYTLPLHFKKFLTGSEGGSCRPEFDIPKLERLLRAGKLRLDDIVTKRYPIDQINTAIDDLRKGCVAGRCLLTIGKDE